MGAGAVAVAAAVAGVSAQSLASGQDAEAGHEVVLALPLPENVGL